MLLSFLSILERKEDRKLIARVYKIFYGEMKIVIYRITGEEESLDFLVDSTMVYLGQNLGILKDTPLGEAKSYILHTAEAMAKGYLLEQGRTLPDTEVWEYNGSILSKEEENKLDALCELSQPELLVLKYKELHMSSESIAKAMGYEDVNQINEIWQEAKTHFYEILLFRATLKTCEADIWEAK